MSKDVAQTKHKLSKEAKQIKRRVAKMRARAKFVGFWYFIGTLALLALTCLGFLKLTVDGVVVDLSVMEFYKVFTDPNATLMAQIVAGVYALVLLSLLVKVIKSLRKHRWLVSKKASKEYGLNRNVMAMDARAKIFSNAVSTVVFGSFLFVLFTTEFANLESVLVASLVTNIPNVLLVLVVAVVIHIFAGYWGAKASGFHVEEGVGIVEDKRQTNRFGYLVRNIVQVAASLALMYFFLEVSTIGTEGVAMVKGLINGTSTVSVGVVLEIVALTWIYVITKHATAATEFNRDGDLGRGMKNVRVFSFLLVATVGAMIAMNTALMETKMLYILAVAFVLFLFEVITRPSKKKAKNAEDLEEDEEGEEVQYDKKGRPIKVKYPDELDMNYYLTDGYLVGEF